jgi:GAF domain-containing protein
MAAAKQKLLVLEDSDDLTRRVREAAQQRGYEVEHSRDATGVLVMARQLQPEALIVDGTLRGAGAVTAVKALRRNVHTADLPIVAVISRTGATAPALLQAGAHAALAEPVDGLGIVRAVVENERGSLDFGQGPAAALAEPARVEALARAERTMSAVPEAAFERLALLASRLLVAPVSLATFVDPRRQYFRAQQGLPEPWASARQTPLSHSFCQWVVSSDEPLVVEDAAAHAVRHNQAISDLGVKSYAGVPVAGKGGQAIGSMCAIDSRPRAWSAEDVKTLEDLARILESYAANDSTRERAAIHATTRILVRFGSRLRDHERTELLAIIDEQAARLAPGDEAARA